jgi:hypothetical protein
MRHYSFSLTGGIPAADTDATGDFADNQAAMDHASLIAKDLARSLAARRNLRVVVRNKAGDEVGEVPLRADLR